MAHHNPVVLFLGLPRAVLATAFAPVTAAAKAARDIATAARLTEHAVQASTIDRRASGAERIEGYARGYAEGHRQGFADGRSRGYEEGHRRAMEQVRAGLDRGGPLDKPWWTGAASGRIPMVTIEPLLPPRRR